MYSIFSDLIWELMWILKQNMLEVQALAVLGKHTLCVYA